MSLSERWWSIIGVSIVLVFVVICSLILFRVTCVNHVDNYELGYKFDTMTGQTTILPRVGYFVTVPLLVKVHTIDLRPMQVCISSNNRVLNCKLVKFNPQGIDLFLSWHGRDDYKVSGRSGSVKGSSFLDDILKAYAYEGTGKSYPFLDVLREMKTSDIELTGSVNPTDNFIRPSPVRDSLLEPTPASTNESVPQ